MTSRLAKEKMGGFEGSQRRVHSLYNTEKKFKYVHFVLCIEYAPQRKNEEDDRKST